MRTYLLLLFGIVSTACFAPARETLEERETQLNWYKNRLRKSTVQPAKYGFSKKKRKNIRRQRLVQDLSEDILESKLARQRWRHAFRLAQIRSKYKVGESSESSSVNNDSSEDEMHKGYGQEIYRAQYPPSDDSYTSSEDETDKYGSYCGNCGLNCTCIQQ